jgi:hypothetical protein
MNTLLLVAAGLVLLVGAAHSYLGERYILIRLFRRTDLPKVFGSDLFTRQTLRFAWHLTTVAWWGTAAILVAAAASRSGTVSVGQIGAAVAATSLVSAVVAFVGSRGRHLSWVAFLAIAALAWWGGR